MYAPSRHGPPVAHDVDLPPVGRSTLPATPDTPATRRRIGYHPVVLPPALPNGTARWGRFSRSALAALALFAVLGLAAGLVARGGNVPIPGLAAIQARATATSTAAPACPAAPLARAMTPTLGSLRLTTGLKNSAQHDYRPVNDVTRFGTGAKGFVTFQVLSSHAGTADVLVCTPGRRLSGAVQVPQGSAGQYVEFPLSFGSEDMGQGMVTISWDGSVAGNRAFTVAR